MPSPSPDNRGPLLDVGTWLALVAMGLVACAKLVTNRVTKRSLHGDDIYTAFAMLCAIGQTIASSMAVGSGLGKHREDLTSDDLTDVLRALYAAQILYVTTVFVTKLGALQFLLKLAVPGHRRSTVLISLALTGLWLVVALLCVSLQCDLPHPWTAFLDRCFNQLVFWTVNTVLDVISQLLVSLLPVYLIYQIKMAPRRKRIAMASFTPNLLTIPLAILRLIFLSQLLHTRDLSFDAFSATLTMNIHTNLSIITVCIPFLKPIVESLSLGIVTADMVTTESPSTSISRSAANLRTFYGWRRLQSAGDRSIQPPRHGSAEEAKGLRQPASAEPVGVCLVSVASPPPAKR